MRTKSNRNRGWIKRQHAFVRAGLSLAGEFRRAGTRTVRTEVRTTTSNFAQLHCNNIHSAKPPRNIFSFVTKEEQKQHNDSYFTHSIARPDHYLRALPLFFSVSLLSTIAIDLNSSDPWIGTLKYPCIHFIPLLIYI